MARKSLKAKQPKTVKEAPIDNANCRHPHCQTCGACLLFAAQVHRCPAPMRPDILEVFLADTRPQDKRTREPLPAGYHVIENAAG